MENDNYKEEAIEIRDYIETPQYLIVGRDEIENTSNNISTLEEKIDELEFRENNDIIVMNEYISNLEEKLHKNELLLDANIVNICEHVSSLESKIKLVSFMSIINLIISITIICIF